MFIIAVPKKYQIKFESMNYEFPEITNGYDGNWLKMNVGVYYKKYARYSSIAYFFTEELLVLSKWLEKIMEGTKLSYKTFVSPELDLSITYRGKIEKSYKFILQIKKVIQLKSGYINICQKPLSFKIKVTSKKLKKVIYKLIEVNSLFPIRGKFKNIHIY